MPSVTLNEQDLMRLSRGAQAEIYDLFEISPQSIPAATGALPTYSGPLQPPAELDPQVAQSFGWEEVADLTVKQVQTWMEAASPKTKEGLRIIAEHGPIIDANLLVQAGIDNLPHFQSRTTMRTRTVTGDKKAFLLTWDDWSWNEDGTIASGRYAVTPITHQSLRRYFGLA